MRTGRGSKTPTVPGRLTADDPRIEQIPECGCWIWMGTLDKDGYGEVSVDDRRRLAHRAFYEAMHGKIPDGFVLDHIACHTRPCVNPDHVRVVTSRVNSLENSAGLGAVNAAKACCPKCGGEYRRMENGARRCDPCHAAVTRASRLRRAEQSL